MKINPTKTKEDIKFVSFNNIMKKLGQTQYISVFVNPNPLLHDDGTPYFQDIRIDGNPDDYYDFKIHSEDVRNFIEKWLEYKKSTNALFYGDKKIEDYL